MSLPQFKLLRPRTVEEAISLLGECSRHAGEAARAIRIVAGGTDLIPSLQQKLFEPQHVLDIRHIPELKGIRQTEEGTEIGALTTLTQIEHSDFLRQPPQYGHNWRQYLFGHALSLVQPVAHLA